MRISKKRIIGFSALFLVLALFAGGCSSTPKPKPVAWNVKITKTTPASIEVDVIGVTPDELAFYEGLSMEKYWPNSQVRKDADKLSAVLQKDEPWLISADDPKWAAWKNRGVTDLLVVANLPVPDGLWKKQLPLDKKAWVAKNRTIEIEIQTTKIGPETPEKIRN